MRTHLCKLGILTYRHPKNGQRILFIMISSRLRQLRRIKGLTLDELAVASKVHRGTIHRIESSRVSPRMDTLADLCQALGTTLEGFFQSEAALRSEGAPHEMPPAAGLRRGALEWLEHAEALIRHSADSLSVLDAEGLVVYESDCALHFHAGNPEERRSRPWWTCAHPEDQLELQATFRAFLQKAEPTALLQYRAAHRDGSWHWVRTTLSRQLDHPLIRGVIASTQDVTLLKRMDEDAHRSRTYESLAIALGGVTHTFSNLLMGIQGHLEVAQIRQAEGSPVAIPFTGILDSVTRATQLLGQMRNYAGNPLMVLEPLDLNALIRSLTPALHCLGKKGCRFSFELEDAIPHLEADRKMIERLLMDLVANACDALGEQPGTVTVRTLHGQTGKDRIETGSWVERSLRHQDDCVVLEVSDTGCGMTPELLQKAFEPFCTTKFMGQGMGLAAVQGIVRAHQGSLGVASEPGRGSTFRLLLPLVSSQTKSVGAGRDTRKEAPAGAILVAEDDPELRSCIRVMLETLGHGEILEAVNGEEALRLYQTHAKRISLVLLDVDMPIMGGAEAFAKLRSLEPSLKILFSTGAWERDPRLVMKISDGTTGILRKPYRMEELKAALALLA